MAKKKKPKKRGAMKVACDWLQKYVRLRDTDELGYGPCCSCGEIIHYFGSNGGHFQGKGRNYNGACLDERNVNLQCVKCNCTLGGNPAGYAPYMLEKYGAEVIDEIKQKSYVISDADYAKEMTKKYRGLCKELAKTKDFEIKGL